MSILKNLLLKKKIRGEDCDRHIKVYLKHICDNYTWLKYNSESDFFYPNYKRFKEINPASCPLIKLKFFYYWKFPPKYKDEDVPEMTPTLAVRQIMKKGAIKKNNCDKNTLIQLKKLEKKGFAEKHVISKNVYYLSTGFFSKFYYAIDDTAYGDFDSFTIINLSNEPIIVTLKNKMPSLNGRIVLTDSERDVYPLLEKAYARNRKILENELVQKLIGESITNNYVIKPFEKKKFIIYLIPYDMVVKELENKNDIYYLIIRGKNFIEKSPAFPL